MNEQEKQGLLVAISGYLPYGLKLDILVKDNPDIHSIDQVRYDNVGTYERLIKNEDYKFDIKPYLRPMSSMTDEEKKEENKLWNIITKTRNDLHYLYTDFLLFHHLDYRGLIEKGLAIEASKDMYNIV